jgi:uncharacterized protein (DUF2267 family)
MPVAEDQIQAAIARRQQAQQEATSGQTEIAQPQTPIIDARPQQGVTDEQIQAAIARRQQSQQGIELGSTPLTIEEVQLEKLRNIEVVSNRSQLEREATASQFLGGNIDTKNMGVFDLMESVNQARTFKDFKQRSRAVDELRKRGVPRDVIETFTKLDDPTGFVQSLKDEAFVGGTAALASGVTGAITKNPRAAAAAAAIAGGVAEVGEEAFNRIFKPERARGGLEFGVDVAKTAAIEGVGDLVGAKIFSSIGGGIKMGANKIFVGNRAIEGAEEISKELARVGKTIKPEDIPQFLGQRLPNIEAGLDPAQKSSSKLTAWLMGSLERAFGGGRLLERKETVNPVILKKIVAGRMDDLMGDIAKLSPTQIGALADDAFTGSQKVFQSIDSANFEGFKRAVNAGTKKVTVKKRVPLKILGPGGKKLFKVTSEVVERQPQVNMKNARSIAKTLLKQVEEGKLLSGFDEDKTFVKSMSKIADSTNIEQAITNRSNLNAMADRLPRGSARNLANQMKAELKSQMSKTARGVSSEAEAMVEQAYKFSSEARKLYFPKILELAAQDVADGIPQDIAGRIFSPDNVTRINQVKDVLLSRQGKSPFEIQKHKLAWDELRFGWLRDQIKASSDVDKIPIMGEKLQGIVDGMGDDTMASMFSKQELQNIKGTVNRMRFVERQATGGSAELARFVQVGAAAGGRFGGKPGLMMTALGGPAALARAMANKNAGSMFLGGKTGQFMGLMAKANRELKKEREKIEKLKVKDIERKGRQLAIELGSVKAFLGD